MFENIIGQGFAVERLRQELEAGSLPSSLLLHGPAYSGKMSAALELARALTCDRGRAEWNCTCRACESQRLLAHPDTLLMGPRYFSTEVAAAADVLSRVRKPATQYLYLRTVRKLLHRFDPILWEGNDAKRAGLQPAIEEIEDRLTDLLPENDLPAEGELSKSLRIIGERCAKLSAALTDNIPISQIRKAVYWAHTTGQSRAKIVIVESADRMLESSRNALLKILEEPPEGVYFILTTTRRGAIMPTLVSRLRPYHFPARSSQEAREVLSKIFREENPRYGDLREYFLAWNDTDVELLKRETDRFLDGVLDRGNSGPPDGDLLKFLSAGQVFRPFLDQLAQACGSLLSGRDAKERAVSVDRLEVFSGFIRECALQSEQYNQSPSLLVECLYYRMREAG